MEFVIQLLKEKKKEIAENYKNDVDFVKLNACKIMTDQINKAINTLEYEHYWKHLNEKQFSEMLGVNKTR